MSNSRTTIFAGCVFLLGAVCVRLGVWQLDRLAERRESNARIEANLAQDPLELGGDLPDVASLLHRQATARGWFDVAHEVVLLNRSRDGEPGVHLITPLRFEDGSGAILVDRGWIPLEDSTPARRQAYASESVVEVRGVILPQEEEPRWSFLADDTPAPGEAPLGEWRVLYVEGIQTQIPYPLHRVYLQLSEAPDGVQPIPGIQLDRSEGPHFWYAVQWFAFATIAFVGGGLWLRRRLGGR